MNIMHLNNVKAAIYGCINSVSDALNISAAFRAGAVFKKNRLFLLMTAFLVLTISLNAQQPSCLLNNVGMCKWYGDVDNQHLGDSVFDDEDNDDLISFRNFGNTNINISGWQLYVDERGTSTPVFTFPASTILTPGEQVTVVSDWNGGGLPANFFDANFASGEGMFEEVFNNRNYAILRNPSTNQYITYHNQGGNGQSLGFGTKVCNVDFSNLIPRDFEGCEVIYWTGSNYINTRDCSFSILNTDPSPGGIEICNNGIDDDGDGQVDSADSDCNSCNDSSTSPCSSTAQTTSAGASVGASGTSGVCLFCSVTGKNNLVDANTSNFASINIPIGVFSSGFVDVNLGQVYPAGTRAGFIADVNGGLAGLFNGVTLTTYLGGSQQQSISGGNLINILGFGGGKNVASTFCQPFDRIRISAGSLAGVLANYRIFNAFVVDGCQYPVVCGASASAEVCGDGIDNDGDGLVDCEDDCIDTGIDTDGDGIPDAEDLDDDNDGITDIVENSVGGGDTDGDGVPNRLDLDSDNDGINDVIEADGIDNNNDGLADGAVGTTPTTNGIPTTAGTGLLPPDTDGDGIVDHSDLDSDDDSISDLIEGGSGAPDADDNGVADEPDTDGDGIVDSVDGAPTFGDAGSPTTLDTDGEGTPDYLDPDSDNPAENIVGVTDGIGDDIDDAGNAPLDANGNGEID
ncbi:MAG: lamin tail domain-containing protein, partial [Saprospiraceae bacterium]